MTAHPIDDTCRRVAVAQGSFRSSALFRCGLAYRLTAGCDMPHTLSTRRRSGPKPKVGSQVVMRKAGSDDPIQRPAARFRSRVSCAIADRCGGAITIRSGLVRHVPRQHMVEKWRVCCVQRHWHLQRNRTLLRPIRMDPCVCNARDRSPPGERSGRQCPAMRSRGRAVTGRQESGLEFRLDPATYEFGRDPHSRFNAFLQARRRTGSPL